MTWLDKIHEAIAPKPEKVPREYKTAHQWEKVLGVSSSKFHKIHKKLKEKNLVDTQVFNIPNAVGVLRPTIHYNIKVPYDKSKSSK